MTDRLLDIVFINPRIAYPFGGERCCLYLADELSKMGHNVTIYTTEYNQSYFPFMKSSRVKVKTIGFPVHRNSVLASFLSIAWMIPLGMIVKRKCDLIITFQYPAMLAALSAQLFYLIKRKAPILYYCLEPPRWAYDLKNELLNKFPNSIRRMINGLIKVGKFLDKAWTEKADLILTIGDWPKHQIRRNYDRDSIIIHPGIEVERFQNLSRDRARKTLNLPLEEEIFLTVSNLHKRKNLRDSISLFCQKRRNEKSLYFIIGSGPEEHKLIGFVKENRITGVHFIGMVSDFEVATYCCAADYFIFTAKNEPFGIAPLEAKAAGCEIIGIDVNYPILTWEEHARLVEKEIIKFLDDDGN